MGYALIMASWGGYPGFLLAVDPDGVWCGECFGQMANEMGGSISLDDFISGAQHGWVREHFDQKVLDAALEEARALLPKK